MLLSLKRGLVLLLVGVASAYSAYAQNVEFLLNIQHDPARFESLVDITVDHANIGGNDISEKDHPLAAIWTALQSDLSHLGEVGKGTNTGFRRHSLRVRASQLDPDLSLGKVPALNDFFKVAKLLNEAVRSYYAVEWGVTPRPLYYLKLVSGRRNDLEKIMACVVVDYLANVEKSLVLPDDLKGRLKSACTKQAEIIGLRTTWLLEDEDVQVSYDYFSDPRLNGMDVYSNPKFLLPDHFLQPFNLCPNSVTLLNLTQEYIDAGWLKSNQDMLGNAHECDKYIFTKVLGRSEEIMQKILANPRLDPNLNEFHQQFIRELIRLEKGDEVEQAKAAFETKVKSVLLNNTLSLRQGVSKAPVDKAFLNIRALAGAIDGGETDFGALFAQLFTASDDVMAQSPLRLELKAANAQDRKSYTRKLMQVIAQECDPTDPVCLYFSANDIENKSAKIRLQQNRNVLFDGFILKAAK